MTPGNIQPTADGQGSVLTYRLDHAISNKGMGISLPTLPQPETPPPAPSLAKRWNKASASDFRAARAPA